MSSTPVHPALARTGTGVAADGTFEMPTRVQFGRGVISTLADEARRLQGTHVMVVTDPGVRAIGLVDPLVAQLEEAGLTVTVFDTVQPNPRDVHCLEGAAIAEAEGVDLFVGVGGGSPIDTAKCIAVLLTNGGHPSAIITDTVRRKKMNLFDPRICPDVALVDPDVTFSMPPHVTAATGMDALSHAIDSLHCLLDTPASDAMALEGARLNALYLERAYADGSDVEARCGMAQASLVAGIAVGITDVSGCHSIAEAIGAVYDHPHGVCCAIGLPMIMRFNLPASTDKYARLAHAFGLDTAQLGAPEAAQRAIDYVRDRNTRLGIPDLDELIDDADLDLLAEKAFANTSTPSNPLSPDVAAFRRMFVDELERTRSRA
jgi:alcohol dehydrogenase